jgi:quercetin dioxygenase-like cupin family protein
MARFVAVAAFVAVLFAGVAAQQPTGTAGKSTSHASHVMITPDEAKWGPPPPGLPPGAEVAILEGDPSASGPFTMRAKFPDGYRVPPHWHPAVEHVTVLEGKLLMGTGEQFAEGTMKPLAVGSFAMMPQGTRHFALAKGPTVIQIHGIGPWGITYVNSSDDPRNK